MVTKGQYDFEQLIGVFTQRGMKLLTKYVHANISDARDEQVQRMAQEFIRHHVDLIQKPTLHGLIEYSASAANRRALTLMKQATGKKKVVLTNLTHIPSLVEECANLGLEAVVVSADSQNQYQVSEENIQKAIEASGVETIAGVVSTYGTPSLGNFERIASHSAVQALRKSHNIWLHLDGAFGAVFNGYASSLNKDIPDADTITVDPYKLVGIQGCALLLGDPAHLGSTNIDYYHHSPLTRVTTLSAGPLAAWYGSMDELGRGGVERIADECVQNARRAAQYLIQQGVHLICKPKTHIIPIKVSSEQQREALIDFLYEQGFKVGRINIQGSNYHTHGARIVCSPRDSPLDWAQLQQLADHVVDFMKK